MISCSTEIKISWTTVPTDWLKEFAFAVLGKGKFGSDYERYEIASNSPRSKLIEIVEILYPHGVAVILEVNLEYFYVPDFV